MTATTHKLQTIFRAIFQEHSLKTKMTLITLIFFLIGIWSLALYARYTLHNDMEDALGAQQFSTVSIIAAEINNGLEDRMKALESIAALITPAMMGNAATMQRFIEGRKILPAMFNGGFFVLLADGTAIADFPLSTGRRGLNFMDRKYASGALKEGKTTIGSPVMGKALRSSLFSIATPIHDKEGKVIGALAGTIDLAKPNFLSRITDNSYGKTGGYLLIAPKIRTIVFATDKKRIMEVLTGPGISSLINSFIQDYEGSGVTINPKGEEILASAKGIPVSGWYIAAIMPTEEAFAPVHALQQRMLLAAIFLTLMLGGLIWWMLKRQLAPVFSTIKTLSILSNTDQHPEPLPISRQDEIGELIGGFNSLLETLGQREEALKESEERFRKLADAGWEGLVFHKDGVLLDGNNSFLTMFGYSAEEIIGKSVFIFLAPESIDLAVQKLKQYSSGGQSYFEGKGLKKDNTIFPIEFMGRPIKYKDYDARVLAIRDITERKRAEEALLESETYYRSLVEGIPGIVYTFSKKRGGVYYSSHVTNLMGYSPEQLYAQPLLWQNSIHSEDLPHVEQAIREAATGNLFCVEYRIRDAQGNWRWFDDRSFGYQMDGAGIIIKGLVLDITERKRAEEKLQDTLESLRKAVNTTIQVMISTIEARDPYTSGHQSRSANLARAIATEMGLPQEQIEGLHMAGSIHDIGKLSIPAEILSKPTKLSDLEFSMIKEHARKGYEMLKDVESPWPLAEIVCQHHERMDGSGYPRNLKGDEILIEARILNVADTVEAMASHRPYRAGLGVNAALNEIEKNRGIFYDEAVVAACLRLFREKGFTLEETPL